MPDINETKHIESSDPKSLAVPDGSLQPGQVLQSRYRILGIIGMGGMGAVYQARDLHFPTVPKLVAIKEMINLAKDQQLREQTLKNFEREAEILATLAHPAIPQIYDFFSYGDRAYLVMEFIQGKDLEAILHSTESFLPTEQIRLWGVEICDVLFYLHNHVPDPIIFRDMKPSNVMVDHHKHIRLIDFGIAKTFQMGQPGTMIGTDGYAAPEQYKGLASPSADIYALGATLHHMLTRKDPRLEPPFSFHKRLIRDYNPN
nr:serine/threonine protein kinase [Anaerolineae bacterium]